jgi:HK97 family phage major capsid protein
MTMSNQALLRKAAGAVGTGDFAATGLLPAEQSTAFLDRVYDATAFSQAQRNERRRSSEGSIPRLGIGGRILRKKNAGVDDATLIKPEFSDIDYVVKRYRADSEIEEEVFEDNIEGEGFEDHWVNTVADQIGRDLEDLHFNGDESVTSDPFLKLNEGWLEQLAAGGSGANRVNGATINSGAIEKGHFFAALQAMPQKYLTTGLKWIGNASAFLAYLEYLTDRATGSGDAALTAGAAMLPGGFGKIEVPSMPASRLILANPKNFIVVTRRDVRYRKTTEGRQAIRQDKRFYAWFVATDPIIELPEAIVDVYGLV